LWARFEVVGCSPRGEIRDWFQKVRLKKWFQQGEKKREGKNHTQDTEKRVRIDCASRAAAGTGTLERTQTFFLLLIPFIGRQAR